MESTRASLPTLPDVAIQTSPVDATLPVTRIVEPEPKGKEKGKAVVVFEGPKRKRWLSEMTSCKQARLSDRERESLLYEESVFGEETSS